MSITQCIPNFGSFFLLLVVYNVILKFRLLFISAYTRQKKRDMGAVRIVSGLRLGSLVSAQHPWYFPIPVYCYCAQYTTKLTQVTHVGITTCGRRILSKNLRFVVVCVRQNATISKFLHKRKYIRGNHFTELHMRGNFAVAIIVPLCI